MRGGGGALGQRSLPRESAGRSARITWGDGAACFGRGGFYRAKALEYFGLVFGWGLLDLTGSVLRLLIW